MFDPKKILTESGYNDWAFHLKQLEHGLSYILNHADDLHIGALDDNQLITLYNLRALLDSKILLQGDGEED